VNNNLVYAVTVLTCSVFIHELGHLAIPLIQCWGEASIIVFPQFQGYSNGLFAVADFNTPLNIHPITVFLIGSLGGLFQVLFLSFFMINPLSRRFQKVMLTVFVPVLVYWIYESFWTVFTFLV